MLDIPVSPAQDTPAEERTGLSLDERLRLLVASPEPLRAWLRTGTNACVGLSSDPARCPLATFLAERLGGDVAVYPDAVTLYSPWSGRYRRTVLASCALPAWARTFVCRIDKPHAGRDTCVIVPVLRDRALAILPPEDRCG